MSHKPPISPMANDAEQQAIRKAAKRIDRVNDRLLVGGSIPAGEYQRFLDAGITHIVDLREDAEVDSDIEQLEHLKIARLQVPVRNHTAPTADQLSEIASWLVEKNNKSVVYVHCGAGIGRAATMAVGLLVHDAVPLDTAIEQVRAVRPEIRINEDQLAWLRSVESSVQPSKDGKA